MKIETGRFILEELASEAEVKYFAQSHRAMKKYRKVKPKS